MRNFYTGLLHTAARPGLGRIAAALGFVALAVATSGLATQAKAEGIEVRGAGCIGPCRDALCCNTGIILKKDGVGFARNFECVAFMGGAKPTERAWICGQLRQKNAVCAEVANFCAQSADCGRKLKNCRDAEDYIDKARANPALEVGEAEAYIKPTLGQIKFSRQADGRVKAEVMVSWSIDKDKTKLTLPDWCWPDMTDAEKAALKRYVDALKVHEEGHVKVAEDFGKEISGTHSATGATQEQAKENLKEVLNKYVEESEKELQFRTKFYDDKTEHGAKQSNGPEYGLPGGVDVVLNCP